MTENISQITDKTKYRLDSISTLTDLAKTEIETLKSFKDLYLFFNILNLLSLRGMDDLKKFQD